jgi:hypothetical protein
MKKGDFVRSKNNNYTITNKDNDFVGIIMNIESNFLLVKCIDIKDNIKEKIGSEFWVNSNSFFVDIIYSRKLKLESLNKLKIKK